MTNSVSKILVTDVSSTFDYVPLKYIRPVEDRPNAGIVLSADEASIPLIDLADLHGPGRTEVVRQIGLACQTDGFFQVTNKFKY